MSRVSILLLVGVVASLVGLALFFGAHSLATTWQDLGPNARGGETDPDLRTTYRVIGGILLVFGLALDLIAGYRWVQEGRRYTLGSNAP